MRKIAQEKQMGGGGKKLNEKKKKTRVEGEGRT